eukprot:30058-Pelagococcus_subviridis.AAC.4
MHFLAPAPNGTNAKSLVTSLGYIPLIKSGLYPAQSFTPGFEYGFLNLNGSNFNGSSQQSGCRCKFHTEMNTSMPLISVTSASPAPFGSGTSSKHRRIKIGGSG